MPRMTLRAQIAELTTKLDAAHAHLTQCAKTRFEYQQERDEAREHVDDLWSILRVVEGILDPALHGKLLERIQRTREDQIKAEHRRLSGGVS